MIALGVGGSRNEKSFGIDTKHAPTRHDVITEGGERNELLFLTTGTHNVIIL